MQRPRQEQFSKFKKQKKANMVEHDRDQRAWREMLSERQSQPYRSW